MTALSHLVPIIMPYICCFFFPSGFDGNISIKLKKNCFVFIWQVCGRISFLPAIFNEI